jgi:hypothetical protein
VCILLLGNLHFRQFLNVVYSLYADFFHHGHHCLWNPPFCLSLSSHSPSELFILPSFFMHCNCTFSKYLDIYCPLHVLNLWAHLQEDGCIYRYGISSVVGRRVGSIAHFFTYKIAYSGACKTHYTIPVYKTIFLKINTWVQNMWKAKKLKY